MYKNLAKKGRFGDSKIAKTSNGSLWHVNKEEKKLIDDYGIIGEQIVNMIGSGTTNPKTGLKEQFPFAAIAAFGSILTGAAQSYGQTRSTKEQGKLQEKFASDSLKSLSEAEDSLSDSLGSSLSIPTLEAQESVNKISKNTQINLENIKKRQDNISSSSGFAGMSMDNDTTKQVKDAYMSKLGDIDIDVSKNLSEILSNFEQTKSEMKLQRQQLEQQKR